MNNLGFELNKEIELLANNFDNSNDKKRLVNTAYLLRFIAGTQGIKVNIPNNLKKEVNAFDRKKYERDNSFVKYYKENYKLNYGFAKMGDTINNEYEFYSDSNYLVRINQRDTLNIVQDFFKDYDKELYDYFNNLLLSNRILFVKKIMDDNEGLTIEKSEITKPYIFIYNNKNIVNPISLSHEVIHAYMSEKLFNMNEEERKLYDLNDFEETYSSFIELAIVDYFNKNKYFNNDTTSYIDEYNDVMLDDLYNYYCDLSCNDINFNDEEEVYVYNKNERYAYGRTLAYYFYRMYLKNKSEGKDNILQFMLDSMKYNKKYMLNNYGLSHDKITDEKRLVRYMNFDD